MSSSKVLFQLDELRNSALSILSRQAQNAKDALAAFDDSAHRESELAKWFTMQSDRVEQLAGRLSLNDVSPDELAAWEVAPRPRVDLATRRALQREVQLAEARMKRLDAKMHALVGNENGYVSLTKNQLTEFFGL